MLGRQLMAATPLRTVAPGLRRTAQFPCLTRSARWAGVASPLEMRSRAAVAAHGPLLCAQRHASGTDRTPLPDATEKRKADDGHIGAAGGNSDEAAVAVGLTSASPLAVDDSIKRTKLGGKAGPPLDAKARRRARTRGEPSKNFTKDELAAETARIFSLLGTARMEDPDALLYPLHTYEEISPAVYRSVRAHMPLIEYVCSREDDRMQKHFADREDAYKGDFTGKAFYLRVLNLSAMDGGGGTARPPPPPTQGGLSATEQAVLAGVQGVVHDYAREFIEPLPNEIACDVMHYAATAPYAAAASVNVKQFVKDTRAVLDRGMVDKRGVPGSPTPPRELEPLSPEDVAKEMAGRISREVLKPIASGVVGGGGGGSDPHGGFRVCIGIAPTPALAKIACDAEVLYVERHREDRAARRAPVRVRSFFGNIQTLRDSKNFIAHFRVAHVPVVTPAFARFLRVVFGIDTVAQLYEKRDDLFFNLSRDTFNACYDIVYGRMRFPDEAAHPTGLFCPENIARTNKSLEVLATNAIAIANGNRTALRGGFLAYNASHVKTRAHAVADSRLNYGRLFTDEQFLELAGRVAAKACETLSAKGFTASGLRLDVRRGHEVQFAVTKAFPATGSREKITAYALEAATVLAPYRQKAGRETTGDFFCVCLNMSGLDVAVLVPRGLEAEMVRTKTAYTEARVLLSYKSRRGNSKPRAKPKRRSADTRHGEVRAPLVHWGGRRMPLPAEGKDEDEEGEGGKSPGAPAKPQAKSPLLPQELGQVVRRPGVNMGRPKASVRRAADDMAPAQYRARQLREQRKKMAPPPGGPAVLARAAAPEPTEVEVVTVAAQAAVDEKAPATPRQQQPQPEGVPPPGEAAVENVAATDPTEEKPTGGSPFGELLFFL